MDQEHPEIIEQTFEGTAQELVNLIHSYIRDHVAHTPTLIGPSDTLELEGVPNDPGLYLIVRNATICVPHAAHTERFVADNGKIYKRRLKKSDRLDFLTEPPVEGTLRVRQRTVSPPRSRFICRAYTEACRQLALALAREAVYGGAAGPGSNEKPKQPDKPQPGSAADIWFDWYHGMIDQGFTCSLKDIAKESNRSYGSVRQLHAHYARVRGLSRPVRPNRQ